jgi:hypothetical protein
MTDSNDRNRVSKGVPTGGQYQAECKKATLAQPVDDDGGRVEATDLGTDEEAKLASRVYVKCYPRDFANEHFFVVLPRELADQFVSAYDDATDEAGGSAEILDERVTPYGRVDRYGEGADRLEENGLTLMRELKEDGFGDLTDGERHNRLIENVAFDIYHKGTFYWEGEDNPTWQGWEDNARRLNDELEGEDLNLAIAKAKEMFLQDRPTAEQRRVIEARSARWEEANQRAMEKRAVELRED